MSIIKNVSGPYTINTINHDDPIILDSNVVIINGNLTIRGNTTTISSTDTDIYDRIIRLNVGTTGTPLFNAGIEVVRGNQPSTVVLWNETADQWQITNDGSTYYNVVATTTGNTRVVDDSDPTLSANLKTANNWITNTFGNVSIDPASLLTLNGNLALQLQTSPVGPVSGYNILTGGNVSAGGTGVYVTTGDQASVSEELITKKRAIVYSIIF